MTARKLFEWAQENITKCHFAYITQKDHDGEEILLKERFQSCKTLSGTHRKHAFIPLSVSNIKTKLYSNSDFFFFFFTETVTVTPDDKDIKDIKGFVTCLYNGKWWAGCVLDAYDDNEFKITFLHQHGPSHPFANFLHPDILSFQRRYFSKSGLENSNRSNIHINQ